MTILQNHITQQERGFASCGRIFLGTACGRKDALAVQDAQKYPEEVELPAQCVFCVLGDSTAKKEGPRCAIASQTLRPLLSPRLGELSN